jgi:hypothetical protein
MISSPRNVYNLPHPMNVGMRGSVSIPGTQAQRAYSEVAKVSSEAQITKDTTGGARHIYLWDNKAVVAGDQKPPSWVMKNDWVRAHGPFLNTARTRDFESGANVYVLIIMGP